MNQFCWPGQVGITPSDYFHWSLWFWVLCNMAPISPVHLAYKEQKYWDSLSNTSSPVTTPYFSSLSASVSYSLMKVSVETPKCLKQLWPLASVYNTVMISHTYFARSFSKTVNYTLLNKEAAPQLHYPALLLPRHKYTIHINRNFMHSGADYLSRKYRTNMKNDC